MENIKHIPKVLPKGTTIEQWEHYQLEMERHELFIRNYAVFMDRICQYLEWRRPDHRWSSEEIRAVISDEIQKKSSMDAPNAPGYYRANND